MKNKSFFGKHKRLPTKESGKTWVFCFVHLKKKKVFFLTNNIKKHIFSDVQKIKKWKWKMMTEKNFRKKKLGDVRKWYFVWKKEIFVRKGKIENSQRTKKTKPQGEEKLKGFHRDVNKEWKKRLKRNTKILQKKEG